MACSSHSIHFAPTKPSADNASKTRIAPQTGAFNLGVVEVTVLAMPLKAKITIPTARRDRCASRGHAYPIPRAQLPVLPTKIVTVTLTVVTKNGGVGSQTTLLYTENASAYLKAMASSGTGLAHRDRQQEELLPLRVRPILIPCSEPLNLKLIHGRGQSGQLLTEDHHGIWRPLRDCARSAGRIRLRRSSCVRSPAAAAKPDGTRRPAKLWPRRLRPSRGTLLGRPVHLTAGTPPASSMRGCRRWTSWLPLRRPQPEGAPTATPRKPPR